MQVTFQLKDDTVSLILKDGTKMESALMNELHKASDNGQCIVIIQQPEGIYRLQIKEPK